MKKLLLLLLAASVSVAFGAVSASAQEKEKVVTGTINLMTPTNVRFLDEYMSNQLYTGNGGFIGLNVKLGAMYRKHENLSWDLYYTRFKKPTILGGLAGEDYTEFLANPAKSQFLKYTPTSIGYGTYYHWQAGKLMLKTGGIVDVYAALNQALPDGVNNATTFDLQTVNTGRHNLRHIFNHAQILGIKYISASLILIYRQIFSGTFFLYHCVFPTTGMGTSSLIGITSGKIITQETSS